MQMLQNSCSQLIYIQKKKNPNSLQAVEYQNLMYICSDSLQGDNIKAVAEHFLFQLIPISVPIKSMEAILWFKAESL